MGKNIISLAELIHFSTSIVDPCLFFKALPCVNNDRYPYTQWQRWDRLSGCSWGDVVFPLSWRTGQQNQLMLNSDREWAPTKYKKNSRWTLTWDFFVEMSFSRSRRRLFFLYSYYSIPSLSSLHSFFPSLSSSSSVLECLSPLDAPVLPPIPPTPLMSFPSPRRRLYIPLFLILSLSVPPSLQFVYPPSPLSIFIPSLFASLHSVS